MKKRFKKKMRKNDIRKDNIRKDDIRKDNENPQISFMETMITTSNYEKLINKVLLDSYKEEWEFKYAELEESNRNSENLSPGEYSLRELKRRKNIFDVPGSDHTYMTAMVKYDIVSVDDMYCVSEPDMYVYRKGLIKKLETLVGENNEFLQLALQHNDSMSFLVKCIADPEPDILLKYINRVDIVCSYSVYKDMYKVLSVVLDPVAFATILCEFYIFHLDLQWTSESCNAEAIFNTIFRKESIEKIFAKVMLRFPGGLLSYRNGNLTGRMLKSIAYFNNHKYMDEQAFDLGPQDIIDVDAYCNKIQKWVFATV